MSRAVAAVDLGHLGLDAGGDVLLKLALAERAGGEPVVVRGTHPDLAGHLRTWCRQHGHEVRPLDGASEPAGVAVIERGPTHGARWVGAVRAGRSDARLPDAIAVEPAADWGLSARGAAVEPGGPTPVFRLRHRDEVWTDRAATIYAQAVAAQWDPAAAIDWAAPIEHDARIESAVVQIMTYLIENEEAALVVPARFLGQIHPHYREIQQVLAVTVADEARHIEVFNRRATMTGHELALSTVGGRVSLQSLLDEPDFAIASFLLSVMGEGSFVSLLAFLERHATDPVTRRIAQLTRNDEARHVAFALAHLEQHVRAEPELRSRLASAVERRHRSLRDTAGLNDDVFDALVLLAAGGLGPSDIGRGWSDVQVLQARWARCVKPGSVASVSRPAKPRPSPRCTPATSCNRGPGGWGEASPPVPRWTPTGCRVRRRRSGRGP